MTIADHLLTRLVESGVRHVFGAPCADNQRLLDVIDAHPDLEWVGSASQLSAAYAADGYARMHGLAAVVTTYSSSARDGIAESFAESVPVLVIAGTPAQPHGSGSPGDRSPSDGDAGDLARAFGAVTCASALLAAGDATAEIDRVLECMLADMRPGYLGVPADLVGAPAPAPTFRPTDRAHALAALDRALADDSLRAASEAERRFAERAETMLAGASSIVVLADQLADRHRVRRQLGSLIRSGNLLSATIAGGKSTIDETTPGFLGLYMGAFGEPSVRDAVETADVVIGAGLRLVDLSSGGFATRLDPDRLIDVQPDRAVAGRRCFDGVSMAAALGALTDIVAGRTPSSRCPVAGAVPADVDERVPDAPLTQAAFWQRIGGFLRPADLIVADQGVPYFGVLGVRLPSDVDVISQPLQSSIGYALPAMIGAQLGATPGRRGVVFAGAGSFDATARELDTIVRRGMAPVIFLLTTDGFPAGRAIGRRPAARTVGAGCDTIVARAATPAELDAALAACGQDPGALVLIEVVLDRHDMPPVLIDLATGLATQHDPELDTTAPQRPHRHLPPRRPQACGRAGPHRRRAR